MSKERPEKEQIQTGEFNGQEKEDSSYSSDKN